MDEEETEVGGGVGCVWSESLEPVCGGITFVPVGTDEGGGIGVTVDDPVDIELIQC